MIQNTAGIYETDGVRSLVWLSLETELWSKYDFKN